MENRPASSVQSKSGNRGRQGALLKRAGIQLEKLRYLTRMSKGLYATAVFTLNDEVATTEVAIQKARQGQNSRRADNGLDTSTTEAAPTVGTSAPEVKPKQPLFAVALSSPDTPPDPDP